MLPAVVWNLRYSANGWLPTCKHLYIRTAFLMPGEWIIFIHCFCRLRFKFHSSGVPLVSNLYSINGYIQFIQDSFGGFSRIYRGDISEFPEEHGAIRIFCLCSLIFCHSTFHTPVLCIKRNRRDFIRGFLGVQRDLPLLTPRKPPRTPQETPSERWTDDTLKKKMRLHSNLKYIRYYNLFRI